MESRPPHHFTFSGGYGDHGTTQQHYQTQEGADHIQRRHYPPQHTQQQPISQITPQEEMDFNKMIAQKMLTAQAPSSGYGEKRINNQYAYGVGIHHGVPEPQPIPPPWETGTSAIQSNAQDENHLPVSQLHQALHPTVDTNSYSAIHNDVMTSASNETAIVDKTVITATAPQPLTNTPKSVTFGTHDKIHQWDEQLDVLKYADEEFFNVAHFLIDVVGVSNKNFDEYRFNDDGNRAEDKETRERRGNGGILSLIFGCRTGNEVDSFAGVDSFGLTGSMQEGPRKYRLSEKLVNDFVSAMKFRMENIKSNSLFVSEEEDGDDIDTRTREIARKVNAYGLPLLPSSTKTAIYQSETVTLPQGEISDKEEEDEILLDTFYTGIKKEYFPVLPTNDDEDENDGGADENENSLSNLQLRAKSYDNKDSPKQDNAFQIPTPVSICTSFLKPKSSIPSKEKCETRLAQIRGEIEKAQQMIDRTQNESVQMACQKRISKLEEERRFYQIIQERYKVQTMMETTGVPYVRKACKERFDQLLKELATLQLDEEEVKEKEEEDDEVNPWDIKSVKSEGVQVCEQAGDVGKSTGYEDSPWYDKVLKCVGEQPLHEEMSAARSGRSNHSHCATAGCQFLESTSCYNPEQSQEQPSSQQHSQGHYPLEQDLHSRSQVRFSDNLHHGRQGSKTHHDRYRDNVSSVTSPRSDETPMQNNLQYPRGQGQRRPAVRRPAASAVKSSTTWLDDVLHLLP